MDHELLLAIEIHGIELTSTAEFAENGITSHIANLSIEWPKEESAAIEDMRNSFSQMLRRSLFVACYSVLEDDLNCLCEHLADSRELSLRVKDLRGQGVSRAQAYLAKVINLRMAPMAPYWEDLSNLGKLRNVIVHRAGRLTEDDRALRHFVVNSKELKIVDNAINIEKGFLSGTLSRIDSFWHTLSLAIRLQKTEINSDIAPGLESKSV